MLTQSFCTLLFVIGDQRNVITRMELEDGMTLTEENLIESFRKYMQSIHALLDHPPLADKTEDLKLNGLDHLNACDLDSLQSETNQFFT